MCGRYGLVDPSKLKQRYNLPAGISLEPNYNVAPSQVMPVVIKVQNQNELDLLKWGLVPSWAKEVKYAPINARADAVGQNAMFKNPFKYKRCLVPASYFFEWHKKEEGKTAYLIKLKDEGIFSFAGLFDENTQIAPLPLKTFTIITTSPNKLMESIHDRMPVILNKEDEDVWLDTSITDPKLLSSLLKPYHSELMQAYKISSLVNDPKNNFPEITKAV